MAGLVDAMVTGQNLADKELEALPDEATEEDVVDVVNALIAQLRANGLVK